jgi:hypothetical protein
MPLKGGKAPPRFELGLKESESFVITNYTMEPSTQDRSLSKLKISIYACFLSLHPLIEYYFNDTKDNFQALIKANILIHRQGRVRAGD